MQSSRVPVHGNSPSPSTVHAAAAAAQQEQQQQLGYDVIPRAIRAQHIPAAAAAAVDHDAQAWAAARHTASAASIYSSTAASHPGPSTLRQSTMAVYDPAMVAYDAQLPYTDQQMAAYGAQLVSPTSSTVSAPDSLYAHPYGAGSSPPVYSAQSTTPRPDTWQQQHAAQHGALYYQEASHVELEPLPYAALAQPASTLASAQRLVTTPAPRQRAPSSASSTSLSDERSASGSDRSELSVAHGGAYYPAGTSSPPFAYSPPTPVSPSSSAGPARTPRGGARPVSPSSARRRHVCHVCGKTVSRNFDLTRHMESVHGAGAEERYRCGQCAKAFSRKDSLQRHQRDDGCRPSTGGSEA